MGFKKPKRAKTLQELKKELSQQKSDTQEKKQWSLNLDENLAYLDKLFDSDDLVIRPIVFGQRREYRGALCYFDGLVNTRVIHTDIMQSLMMFVPIVGLENELKVGDVAKQIKAHAVTVGEIVVTENVDEALVSMMSGETLLFLEYSVEAIYINTRGWPARGVESSANENVVRGPRDSFVETMRFNTAMIRRWIRDPALRCKVTRVGRRTQTDISILYIEGVADPAIVEGVMGRLKEIDVDAIIGDAQVEELIEDQWLTLFPTMQTTQRTDKVAAGLLEGRVAIVTDRTPQLLIVPATLPTLIQGADDYYNRWPLAISFRFLRWLGLFIALYLPGLYVALVAYSPELIPLDLAIRMAGARANIPFPVVIEVLILEVSIEILREAAIRLPGALGATIGIVGGFILGDAAVTAGLISPMMVIIVATTALASYTLPDYGLSLAIRSIRFPMLLAAAVAGLYGIVLFSLFGLIHLCSLELFGVSYMAPIAPYYSTDQQDTILRVPYWAMIKRPSTFKAKNINRQKGDKDNWWSQIAANLGSSKGKPS